jgi:hypothetical protein
MALGLTSTLWWKQTKVDQNGQMKVHFKSPYFSFLFDLMKLGFKLKHLNDEFFFPFPSSYHPN